MAGAPLDDHFAPIQQLLLSRGEVEFQLAFQHDEEVYRHGAVHDDRSSGEEVDDAESGTALAGEAGWRRQLVVRFEVRVVCQVGRVLGADEEVVEERAREYQGTDFISEHRAEHRLTLRVVTGDIAYGDAQLRYDYVSALVFLHCVELKLRRLCSGLGTVETEEFRCRGVLYRPHDFKKNPVSLLLIDPTKGLDDLQMLTHSRYVSLSVNCESRRWQASASMVVTLLSPKTRGAIGYRDFMVVK